MKSEIYFLSIDRENHGLCFLRYVHTLKTTEMKICRGNATARDNRFPIIRSNVGQALVASESLNIDGSDPIDGDE